MIPVIGLPVAFWLWHWRDKNVRDQIEEQRKQVANQFREIRNQTAQLEVQKEQLANQNKQLSIQREQIDHQKRQIIWSEFQVIQKHAAGLFSEDGELHSQSQIQISALHQLRGFITRDNPEVLRRAALELILAGHSGAMEQIGVGNWDENKSVYENVQIWKSKINKIALERIKIFSVDHSHIFNKEFSFSQRNLDFLDFKYNANLDGLDFSYCSMIGANIAHCSMNNARLYNAKMQEAYATEVTWRNSELTFCDLQGAFLENSDFAGASFYYSDIRGADLNGSSICNSYFYDNEFSEETNFHNVVFNNRTEFSYGWADLPEEKKDELNETE